MSAPATNVPSTESGRISIASVSMVVPPERRGLRREFRTRAASPVVAPSSTQREGGLGWANEERKHVTQAADGPNQKTLAGWVGARPNRASLEGESGCVGGRAGSGPGC